MKWKLVPRNLIIASFSVALLLLLMGLTFYWHRLNRPFTFNLNDGTNSAVSLISLGIGTNHNAYHGTIPQKMARGLFGSKFSSQIGGIALSVGSQNLVKGTFGVFLVHHLPETSPSDSLHRMSMLLKDAKGDRSFFLSASFGELALWECPIPEGPQGEIVVLNAKGLTVAKVKFRMEENRSLEILE